MSTITHLVLGSDCGRYSPLLGCGCRKIHGSLPSRVGLWLVIWSLFSSGAATAAPVLLIGQNFTASTLGVDSGSLPPDSNGAVGPDHFVQFINGRYSVYNKTNATRLLSKTDLSFWSAAGVTIPSQWDVSDPRLIFDPRSQRWFAAQIDFDPSGIINTNHFLLAISTTANPTGTWKGFAFLSDPGKVNFADFPTLGLDAQGVYLSGDMFDTNGVPVNSTVVSIPKEDLLAVTPSIAGRTMFTNLSYSSRGEIIQPAIAVDGTTGGNLLATGNLGLNFQPHNTLKASTVLNTASEGAATLSAATTISVPSYTVPLDPVQPDGTTNLDNGDNRFSASVYRVKGVLYGTHSIEVNNRAAIRWYRISATNYTLLESGTITDNQLDLFFPSIAANTNGTVVIGCNGSSLSTFVSAYAVAGTTVNGVTTFGSLRLLKSGAASFQNTGSDGTSRWGDYSATSVDPADSTHFWTIQMFPSSSSRWSTQVTELLTSGPRLSISRSGANLLICWQTTAPAFQLQTTSALSANPTWTPVTQTFTSGNQTCALVTPSSAQQFFRLLEVP